ncbi:aspartyl protease family protein [Rhizobium sp. RU20A]|uniref:retropepsin-like aspartic protease family protein n=1 Tax=Rhizobium sp. RU20A TaxID=1907412 RepID=UPI000955B682|nr:TIGR02281 family clan AA aspartic protease [Rhizobium sp. RU20A]SIQ77820.1 aspartyl protease family protein [Rhizobium sp. RU20A]
MFQVVKALFAVALLTGVAALTVPGLTTAFLSQQATQTESQAPRLASTASSATGATNTVRIEADASHHFRGRFRINGRATDGLIDTGATSVALNESTARRLGILPVHYRDKVEVSTANGRVSAERVVIERIEIGPIVVRDIEGVVLPDTALQTTLIGMSFLRKLGSYRVADGRMELVR